MSTDSDNRSSADIEREVERTRARLSDTLDELRDRMSPGQVVDQLVDYARDTGGGEFVRNLGRSMRDNPLPILLIGTGIAWLMLGGGPSVRRIRHGIEDAYEDYSGSGSRGADRFRGYDATGATGATGTASATGAASARRKTGSHDQASQRAKALFS